MNAYEKAIEELEAEKIYGTPYFTFPSVGDREMDTCEERGSFTFKKISELMTHEERMTEHNM